jgi:redox-sensitive bicupin YhaK (pirin superfamily)
MIDIRPASSRFHTQLDWLDSWHSFSFGEHFDPDNRGHGLLLVSNDDTVAPGGAFLPHGHRDMEIITWVLAGRLEHADTLGNRDVIYPGLAQRMSAGTGIRHSETNPSPDEPVHFVQMWVRPDELRIDPGYQQADVADALRAGALVPVASGSHPDAAIRIHQHDATLWAGRVSPASTVVVPDGPHVHAFVAAGSGQLEQAGALGQGDAVRLTAAGALELTAGDDGAELLVWVTA